MPYWDSLRPRNVLDVFNPELPSIVEIGNQLGELTVGALMVKWMNSFLRFYSTNGTMDAIQVSDTIALIRETYPCYTQEDFKLFFNMAKKGMFGQIFGRMDGEVIMNWLAKYDIHRDTVAQSESIKEAERFKPLIADNGMMGGISRDEYLKKRNGMMRVTIYWNTKDEQKIKRIRERFGIGDYTSLNGESPTEIKDEDVDLLRETEKRGFIQIRFKPE